MRRTVKAWIVLTKRGGIPWKGCDGPVSKIKADSFAWGNQPGDKVVQCVVTFNDGKPTRAKARRK